MVKRYLAIVAALLVLAVGMVPAGCRPAPQDLDVRDKAAIIDQLYLLEPNPEFIATATRALESYGFQVDVWQGEAVTVELYRELPEYGYKLILFRVHSGLLLTLEDSGVRHLENSYLFTGEGYSTTKYVSEQLTNKVANAMMAEDYPLVFAVNSQFIKESKGNYDRTVIIAMGCESYYLDDMPAAFMKKGASVYIGWNDVVSLEYVNRVSLDLLANMCTENMTIARSVDETTEELGHDPYFHAYLKYFPAESGNKTVQELITVP